LQQIKEYDWKEERRRREEKERRRKKFQIKI